MSAQLGTKQLRTAERLERSLKLTAAMIALRLFEIALVFVRFDHVAGVIVNANHGIVSYGRGGGLGRGLGVNAGLGVGEGLGVKVGVAVGVAVKVGVEVGVTVGVCVTVAVGVNVAVGVAVGVVVGVGVVVVVGVGVGVPPLCTSKEPLSMRSFSTRGKPCPRWSKKGGGVKFGSPASMAELPGNSAWVNVGPPLSCNGPSIGSVLIWSPSPVRKPPPSSLLRL